VSKRLKYSEVGKSGRKPVIGILGGICSGKSTVAGEFGKLGCKVIDVDKIAHELISRPDIRERIVAVFGQSILNSSGKINRRKLAEVVFSDNARLLLLNKIVHPAVFQSVKQLIEQWRREEQVKAIVLDMPLLAESGWESRCDRLVFVRCSLRLREKRAEEKGFSKGEVKIRENFQNFLDSKERIADNIVDNNSSFSVLIKQVADVFSCIMDNG